MSYFTNGSHTIQPLIIALIIVAGLLILAFEIWMFVDAVTNKKISSEEKAIWVVGMLLIHPFVGIAYYFISRQAKKS